MSDISHDNKNLVLAKEYAEKHGDTENNIVQMIRDGALAGQIKDNIWYVDIALSNSIITASGKNDSGNNSKSEDVDAKLAGIGGWLILPAIGLVLGPIIGVIGLIAAFGMYSKVERAGYGGIYALELMVVLGFLVFTIYAAVLFFQKKRNAPRTIIILLVASIAASVVLLVIELGAEAEVFAIETGKQLVREIIGASIWVPYFRASERVKATFIN